MREESYIAWMMHRGFEAPTQGTSISTLKRIEAAYGPLEDAYKVDGFENILSELSYSKSDERNNQPNPSRLEIGGNLYKSLASLRTHLNYYRRFLESQDTLVEVARVAETVSSVTAAVSSSRAQLDEQPEAVFSMERDLNAALRRSLSQLAPDLKAIDGGRERSVESGRIDILAEDASGTPVIIELKAVTAPRDAVAQVLSYMGDIATETGKTVRGFLVAPEFDPRAVSAARMVPNLRLFRFGFSFTFLDVLALPNE